MAKPTPVRRKTKKLRQTTLPQVMNVSKKGPGHPNLVKVIAAFRGDDE